jgi:hypothetical protein
MKINPKFAIGPWEDGGDYIETEGHMLICHFEPPFWSKDELFPVEQQEANKAAILDLPEIVEKLAVMTALVKLKYGNKDQDVHMEILAVENLLSKHLNP